MKTLLVRLKALFRRKNLEAEMEEEMRHHLEERTAAHVRAGMPPDEARYAAIRGFGNVDGLKEQARDQWAFAWLEQVLQDLRYALRQFARSPGYTLFVVVTLALGIGSTTAILSAINATILNPLPGRDAERVVMLGERGFVQGREERTGVSPPVLEALQSVRDHFEATTWYESAQIVRKFEDFTTIEVGAWVETEFFDLLGARPLLGRTFLSDEEIVRSGNQPEIDGPIVISHEWWRTFFSGSPEVLGRQVDLGGRRFTVVGVMPAHFRFPNEGVNYWLPAKPERLRPGILRAPNTSVLIKLKPDGMPSQVDVILKGVADRLMSDHPSEVRGYGQWWGLRPNGLQLWHSPLRVHFQDGSGSEELQRTLFGLLATAAFVLLIMCANIANLTLARIERRQHELSIRLALGVGRARLMRQLLTESAVLGVLGGIAGIAVAGAGLRLLATFNTLPRLRPLEVDFRVLGVALLISMSTGPLFGLLPACRVGRLELHRSLARSVSGAVSGMRQFSFRAGLVMVQVSLTVVLLTGAGLMLRSVVKALNVDPGFDPSNLLTIHLNFGGAQRRAPTESADRAAMIAHRNSVLAQLVERYREIPGVKAAGLFRAHYPAENAVLETDGETVEVLRAYTGMGEASYFRTAGIPILAGRAFGREDIGVHSSAVVVSELMASACWPGESAIGKRFRTARVGSTKIAPEIYEVIGVVGDVQPRGFNEHVHPTFYRAIDESTLTGMSPAVLVRTERDPRALIGTLRAVLKATDPDMMLPHITIARQVLFDATKAQRTYRNYLLVFGSVALVLSAVGIYGSLAYSVARRTKELGVRLALGAGRRHVLALVMRDGAGPIGVGIVAGCVGSVWLTRFLTSQLFEVSPLDPFAMAGAIAFLLSVALLACYLPARRATRINPIAALRTE